MAVLSKIFFTFSKRLAPKNGGKEDVLERDHQNKETIVVVVVGEETKTTLDGDEKRRRLLLLKVGQSIGFENVTSVCTRGQQVEGRTEWPIGNNSRRWRGNVRGTGWREDRVDNHGKETVPEIEGEGYGGSRGFSEKGLVSVLVTVSLG